MLASLREFFEKQVLGAASASDPKHGERLATAALLVEMSRADFRVREGEIRAIEDLVHEVYELSREETRELIRLAEDAADDATSLYPFTDLINQHFSPEQKAHVIELLWRVALADGNLDKYEEHLVRKVADLIFVPHSTFIRTKLRVIGDTGT